MGGMVGRKKLSEPEKMLVWYEDAFESERACFEQESAACVRAKFCAKRSAELSLNFRREAPRLHALWVRYRSLPRAWHLSWRDATLGKG